MKKHTSWMLKKGYCMEELMTEFMNFKLKENRVKCSVMLHQNIGILSYNKENISNRVFPSLISLGIFLKENDLVTLDRKIPQQKSIEPKALPTKHPEYLR